MAKREVAQTGKNSKEEVTKTVKLPVKWNKADEIPSIYASNIVVHILENEFKLSFFEMKPELRTDAGAPMPTEVRADCVANIILNPKKILPLINALKKQHATYERREHDLKEIIGTADLSES